MEVQEEGTNFPFRARPDRNEIGIGKKGTFKRQERESERGACRRAGRITRATEEMGHRFYMYMRAERKFSKERIRRKKQKKKESRRKGKENFLIEVIGDSKPTFGSREGGKRDEIKVEEEIPPGERRRSHNGPNKLVSSLKGEGTRGSIRKGADPLESNLRGAKVGRRP